MKLQLFVLLGLLCSSAFSAITITNPMTVTYNSVTYGLGKATNNCGVTRVESGQTDLELLWTSAAAAGACDPQAIINIGSNIWVVVQVAASADILSTTNAASGDLTGYDYVIPTASEVDGMVVVGRITMTNDASFGKFAYATQFASQTAAGVWGAFDVTDVDTCSTTIQIKGDTAGATYFLVDQDGDRSTVSGDDVYVAYSTTTNDFEADTEDTKPCSGLILSVASAIATFVALLF